MTVASHIDHQNVISSGGTTPSDTFGGFRVGLYLYDAAKNFVYPLAERVEEVGCSRFTATPTLLRCMVTRRPYDHTTMRPGHVCGVHDKNAMRVLGVRSWVCFARCG